MDFRGNCQQVIDFQNESLRIDDTISQKYLKEYDKKISEIMFVRQEAGVLHNSFEWAYQVYDCVKNYRMEKLEEIIHSRDQWKHGVLADDTLRSSKNLAICLYSFVVQFAIQERVVDNELMYSVSDACIQLVERADNVKEVERCIYASLYKFANVIRDFRQQNYHYLVKKSKDYIYKHFHEEILVEEMAEALGVNASYLSRIFKKSEGIPVKQYIIKEKVYRAENLLMFSDYSISEVGRYLGFSSQSHFTKVFRLHTGMTPNEYRKQHSDAYKKDI